MPKVSSILTSYNHEKYIRDSIISILEQTFEDFELIIIDDASADNSWEIINSFKDPRIKAYKNEKNQGLGNIRRAIKELAKGELIAIHHSDDIWEPTKLEKQVIILENNPDVAAVFTHATIINENGEPLIDDTHPYSHKFDQPNRSRHEWLRYFFYNGNALCNPSSVRRKKIDKQIIPIKGLHQLPDFSFWIQYCLQHEIFVIQEKLIRFRVRMDNQNWSGNRPETRVRLQYELLKIMSHYEKITPIDELLLIFPEAKEYIDENNADLLFALGMIAVKKGNNEPSKLFGLNLLFDAINDPDRSERLRKYQGFDRKAFIELTGRFDVFSNDLTYQMTNIINQQKQTIHDLEQQVLFYSNSKSWRYTSPLRQLSSIFKEKR